MTDGQYAPRLTLQGRLVNFMAGAEVRRRSWEGVASRTLGFERRIVSTDWRHGGELYLGTGVRAPA